ncbi:MAG: c-type cytochrome [Planctomycetes bacterium]|nr:c-type cytochrome [Planctomycetota bacterium]
MRLGMTLLGIATLAACTGEIRKAVVQDGATLYRTQCATCHGPEGHGDGPAAAYLFPKPRDLTKAKYKIRTTANGELPTDCDLMETLTRGIPGTAMPSFAHLAAVDRQALVAHIKSFAVIEEEGRTINLFERFGRPRIIILEKEWPATPELMRKGAEVYRTQGCAKCHGDSGVGDGPSAPTLVDDWGYPIPPANFTRGLYKGGGSPSDIYMRFTTGLNGTPMPSFETALTEEERWALVHYVKSLERPGRPEIPAQKSQIHVAAGRVKALPRLPFDEAWTGVPATEIPLMPLWQRPQAPDVVMVRATHDGESVAILLEWEDARIDGLQLRPQDFPDGAAVMFAMSDPPGHFTMGEKDRPANLWHWRMDRQLDMAKYWDVEDLYPGMVADDYPLAFGPKVHRPIASAPSHDPTFLTAKGAGNPAARTERATPVEDLNAIGFGTLEPQPREAQNVQGRGAWAMGRWRVVFIRALATPDAKDVPLPPGRAVQIGFAVWDGGAGDRDGQKSVTFWQVLDLEP